MPQVKVRNNNVESALRVFKKKCADIVWEYRQREHYTPKSEQRRLAKKAAISRAKRKKNDTKQF
jgi:ribosomal protein S21